MQLYISKTHNHLNGKPFTPEGVTKNICLNPMYKATVRQDTQVLLDSGAFQDVKSEHRLSYTGALKRQLAFEEKQGFISKLIVSYDRLVDEKHDKQLGQIKKRVSHKTGTKYVRETIDAAKFLADQRNDLRPRKLVLSNQGVTVPQYTNCIKEVLSFSEKEDIIGFGGFCIVGQKPYLKKHYYSVLEKSLPMIKHKGIKRIHLFGIGTFDVLVRTHFLCKAYGIEASYDTSAYELRAVMGQVCNPIDVLSDEKVVDQCPFCKNKTDMSLRKLENMKLSRTFFKGDKFNLYHPNDMAIFNIRLMTYYWEMINKIDSPVVFV